MKTKIRMNSNTKNEFMASSYISPKNRLLDSHLSNFQMIGFKKFSLIVMMILISIVYSLAQQHGKTPLIKIDSMPLISPIHEEFNQENNDLDPEHLTTILSMKEKYENNRVQTGAKRKNQVLINTPAYKSSSTSDMDNDGILDDVDLCPNYMDTALDFDGMDDYVTVPHDPALNVGVGDFTFQAWVHSTGTDGYNQTILCKGTGLYNTEYWFAVSGLSVLAFHYAGEFHIGTATVPPNEWTHVAVTFDYTTKIATFYVNGEVDVTFTYSNPPDTSDTNTLFISRQGYSCQCNPFEGRIDDIAIWNVKRTAEQISSDMATSIDVSDEGLVACFKMNESTACVDNTTNTTIIDQSPNAFEGTLNNFSLQSGCLSNWSSGRNLDSDEDGIGDGCDYDCYSGSLSVLYVDSSAITGNNVGNSWENAYLSLSDAMVHANECPDIDSIYVASGTYFPDTSSLDNPRTATFTIPEGVQILGQFPIGGGLLSERDSLNETILSGDIGVIGDSLDNSYHVVYATNITSTSTIDGFTITKGLANGSLVDGFGGGWFNDNASPNISQCKFIDNTSIISGGGLTNFFSNSVISKCTFTACMSINGGAIYNEASSPTITNCEFTSNMATASGEEGNGGAISNLVGSTLTLSGCTFTSNSAKIYGGGLYNSGTSSYILTNSTFQSNQSFDRGGGIYDKSTQNSLLDSCFFIGNSAAIFGGGLFCQDKPEISLIDCQFNMNTSTSHGGGSCFLQTPIVAENVTFSNNSSNFGGGVFFQNSPLDLENLIFNNNSANKGGGLYVHDGSIASIKDCQFNMNTSTSHGGGMYLNYGSLNAENLIFNSNSSDLGGGVWSQNLSETSLINCQFNDNFAETGIGGMSIFEGTLTAENCVFTSNSKNALYLADLSPSTISKCSFLGNSSDYGGGGCSTNNGGDLLVKNCIFRNNQSHDGSTLGTGGGFQLFGEGQTDFINCLFENNKALGTSDDGGGAIMIYGGAVNLINSTIVNNFSATKGGAVSLYDNTCTFNSQNSIFWDNTSSTDTIIYNGNSGLAAMNHCLLDADSCISNVICNEDLIYNQDPQFIDTIDFRIQLTSPGINAGDTIGISNQLGLVDLDSLPRIESCQIDLGAYEYQGITKTAIYVDESAQSGHNNGNTWANAYLKLSDALKLTESCPEIDSIHVAAGTYVPDTSGLANHRQASFIIPAGVNILGQFPMGGGELSQRDSLHETILSGDIGIIDDSLDNVFHVVSATNITSTSFVDGFTITKGHANGGGNDSYGGGWFSENNTSLEISNCTFELNTALLDGGGLWSYNDSISITNCQFRMNKAQSYGGGIATYYSTLLAEDIAFTNNTAKYGGGLSVSQDSVSITNCQFTSNSAVIHGGGAMGSFCSFTAKNASFKNNTASYGGGLYYWEGPASLMNCDFYENTAIHGGGICAYNPGASDVKNSIFKLNLAQNGSNLGRGGACQTEGTGLTNFYNCLFEANEANGTAENGGGAIAIIGTEVNLINSTLVDNHAATQGGAVSLFNNSSTFTGINSIFWNNTSPNNNLVFNGNGGLASLEYSLIDANSCISNVNCNAGMIYNQDPLFLNAPNGDFRLFANSPARNTGDGISGSSSNTTNFDLVINPRFVNMIDMGAYENQCDQSLISDLVLTVDDSPLSGIYKASQSISIEGAVSVMPGVTVELIAPLAKVGLLLQTGNGANIIINPNGCN
jgi:hypothetical protein